MANLQDKKLDGIKSFNKEDWSSAYKNVEKELTKEPLTISINSKGEIYIQEHQVTYQKMVPKLLAIAKNRTDTRIYVRGDKNINYGRVLEIMGTLSGAGFSKVALISEPYKN